MDGSDSFATTHWSVIHAAAGSDDAAAREALSALCQSYWLPLYAYVRRRVASEHEAQDLTQGFFARLLEKNDVAAARRERGRFRAFLLTSFKHYLANEWDKRRAAKRGGGETPLSLDLAAGESRLRWEPDDPVTPEQVYQRQWVLTVLGHVLDDLRAEWEVKDKAEVFTVLKPWLTGTPERGSYAEAAERLDTTEGAARMAVQRLRSRYRELLHQHIAQTVRDPDEVDEEIASLFAAVRPAPRILDPRR